MAFHHGTDLSAMRIPHAESGFRRIDSILSWSAVERRTLDLRRMYPGSHLPDTHLTYLHLRHGTANGDTVALRVYDELSAALAQVFGWVIAVIRPNHISLAGGIAVLGERFLATVVQKIAAYLPAEEIASTTFSLAYSDNLSAIGAAALALQREVGIV
jgi:predicted NBD/HSP70 family sugar kinase